MLKVILAGIVLPVMALLIAMPTPTFAESRPQPRSNIRRHSNHRPQYQRRHHVQRHHVQHRRRHHRHVRGHRQYHGQRHERRQRRRHHGAHIDIRIGGHHHRPTYRHGHPRHVHDDYCPIVISYRQVVVVPTWEVYYHSHRHRSSAAILHIILAPFDGDLYIDGEYHGGTDHLDDGKLKLPVSPGLHTVQLRSGGRTYTQKVRVQRGATAVVKAKKR